MTDTQKEKFEKDFAEVLSQRTGKAPENSNLPLVVGDTLTFSGKGKSAKELVKYHPKQGAIGEWFGIISTDGREISQSNLVKRAGNGIVGDVAQGDTPDARFKNFIEQIMDSDITLRVAELRTRPARNAGEQMVNVVWEKL